jgi:hypothetical protein
MPAGLAPAHCAGLVGTSRAGSPGGKPESGPYRDTSRTNSTAISLAASSASASPAGQERPVADRGKRARSSRAAHQLARRCGSAIGRARLSRLWKKPAAAGCGDWRPPKTSAFWGVAQVEKGHGWLFPRAVNWERLRRGHHAFTASGSAISRCGCAVSSKPHAAPIVFSRKSQLACRSVQGGCSISPRNSSPRALLLYKQ